MPNDVERLAGLLAANDVSAARELAAAIESTNPAIANIARSAHDAPPSDATGVTLQIATLYLFGGRRDLAVATALGALTADASPDIRTSVATIFLGAERYVEARELLHAVIEEHPDHREAHLNFAAASFRVGDHGAAMTSYARAFDLDATDLRPIHNMIEMFAEIGKWVGALSALNLSRQGEPPPEVAIALDLAAIQLTQLAAGVFPRPRVDAASDKCVRDLAANAARRGPRSQLVVARAFIDIERYAEASALAQSLAQRELTLAERADLYFIEGLLAEHARKRELAVDRYAQAIAADPMRSDAATNALSLLVAHGTPDSLLQIQPLLAKLDPGARAASATLAFNEARYIHKAALPIGDARVCLERVLTLTGGVGELADMARDALKELERT